MKIEKLKYFIDLYDTGSFTQTAKMNYISQTSVTQFIYSLESEFQVKLFNRSTIPITPTEAGKVFYSRAQLLYSQYQHSLAIMTNFQKTAHTPLKIGFTSQIDLPILLPMILDFKKVYPEIRISTEKIRIKDTMQALKSMQCDIVVGLLNEDEKLEENINSVIVYDGHFVAVVSREDAFANKSFLSLYEAFSHDLSILSPEEIGASYDQMIEGMEAGGIQPNVVAKCSDITSQLFSIATEHLLGFFPDNFSLNDFSDVLIKVPIENNCIPFKLHLAYRENDNPSIPYFLDFLPNYSKNE